MLATVSSAVLVGLASHPVRVEVQTSRGIPSFELVGLAEAAVRESRVRVKAALASVGIDISEYRITVNLAPADFKKRGSAFDLAIAVATLAALGAVPEEALEGTLFLGELSLNGGLHALRGVIAHLVAAKARGEARVVVPASNAGEAALVDGLDIAVAGSLGELLAALRGERTLTRVDARCVTPMTFPTLADDLAEVRGQSLARRALEIAAAGAHNLMFVGPPGAGKTMLARRLPGILPLMSREEQLEVLAIHGIAGMTHATGRGSQRPFRAPHHTASDVAIVGGGDHARPGEVSLAHNGVLFLDELAEFRRCALEALRQPLEDGFVTVSRVNANVTFPARPMLVAATNPCPCGHQSDRSQRCSCGTDKIRAYRARLSGPLLDRLDIHVVVPPVDVLALQSKSAEGEGSAAVRARVAAAREIARSRHAAGETRACTNAALGQSDVERVCALDAASARILAQAVTKLRLSARAYGKILRVARTLADLDGKTAIAPSHVSEAVGARVLDRDPALASAA